MPLIDLHQMKKTLPQIGQLTWIGLRPEKRINLQAVEQVQVSVEHGLEGDHYRGKSGKRQVTLIQGEHVTAVAQFLQRAVLDPSLLRRNLVVYGINLQAFQDQQLRIGADLVLEMTGQCHPCSRMEENLGPGGYNAMRGHGGITAKVIQGGMIRLGDKVYAAG